MLRLLSLALLWAALAAPALAQLQGSPVRLELRASLTGQHVEGATVSLTALDDPALSWTATSDAIGEVHFPSVPVGIYRVEVTPLRYGTETFSLVVGLGAELRRTLELTMARELPEVVVADERIVPALARRGFYERQRAGFGHHLTADDVRATAPTKLTDALRRIPSVQVRGSGPNLALVNTAATDVRAGGLCAYDVWVDGVRMVTPEGYFDGEMIPVDEVIGVEVFARAMHVPQRFRGPGCGAILIWTGSPERE
jgi:hypothetical protein